MCAFEHYSPGQKLFGRIVSIRRTDLCAFELRWYRCRLESVEVSIRRTDLCAFERRAGWPSTKNIISFQSVERICVPSNVFGGAFGDEIRAGFNPSNGFVCLRTAYRPILVPLFRVSIRRTDLCAFERPAALAKTAISQVSIRRTDLCAFEHVLIEWNAAGLLGFNPSNGFVCLRTPDAAAELRRRRSDSFNPSNGFVCLRTSPRLPFQARTCPVSIRRTDLCAFEHALVPITQNVSSLFQSVERICVPSNANPKPRGAVPCAGFNPSNGFVCLRTARVL